MDSSVHLFPALSARFTGSYAYKTVKDRMPIIVTKAIDYLCREKTKILNIHGDVCSDDIKTVIGKLSQLRSEMQTNKQLQPITVSDSLDFHEWSNIFNQKNQFDNLKWFESSWLFVECYMYRIIQQAFEQSTHLKKFDPFESQKFFAFSESFESIEQLMEFTNNCLQLDSSLLECSFYKLMEMMLWGNRNDLSFSAGNEDTTEKKSSNIVEDTERLKPKILVNSIHEVWQYIQSLPKIEGTRELSIILDNCGLEIVADLCFATFCMEHNLFNRVRFYVKRIPWFVSDVTSKDFTWTIETFRKDPSKPVLQILSEKWSHYLQTNQWEVIEEKFWTLPLPYHTMKKEDNALYEKLSQSQLLIFKGDLNYRKLGADLQWPTTTSFETFLQGFQPAPLVVLRTIKAEIVCGLPPGREEELLKEAEDWMYSGDYAVVQFSGFQV